MSITHVFKAFPIARVLLYVFELCLWIWCIRTAIRWRPEREAAAPDPTPQGNADPAPLEEADPAPQVDSDTSPQAAEGATIAAPEWRAEQCIICKGDDEPSGLVTFCTHFYHLECINGWWDELAARGTFKRGECVYCFEPAERIRFGCGHDCARGNIMGPPPASDNAQVDGVEEARGMVEGAHSTCKLCVMEGFHQGSRIGAWFLNHPTAFRSALGEGERQLYDYTTINRRARSADAMPTPTTRAELASSLDNGMSNWDIFPVRRAMLGEHPRIRNATDEQWTRVLEGDYALRVKVSLYMDLEKEAYSKWSRGEFADEDEESEVLLEALRAYRRIDRQFEHLWDLLHDYDLDSLRLIRKAQSWRRDWDLNKLEKELEECRARPALWRKLYLPLSSTHGDGNTMGVKALLDQVLGI